MYKRASTASNEALWAANDPYLADVKAGLPLDVLPSGATKTGVTFVTNAPGAIPNAAYFPNGSSNIVLPNTNFQLNSSADFCIEWWQNLTSVSILASLWHPGVASGCAWSATAAFTNLGMSYNASFAAVSITGISVPASVWNHVAICRAGGSSYTAFVNGKIVGTSTVSTTIFTGDLPFYLGYRGESSGIVGYLAGFRLTRGNCRYTKPFTPSTVFY